MGEVVVRVLSMLYLRKTISLLSNKIKTSSCLRPLLLFIGCSLRHGVLCFQGNRVQRSAAVSSRRQLSECLCYDVICHLNVLVLERSSLHRGLTHQHVSAH